MQPLASGLSLQGMRGLKVTLGRSSLTPPLNTTPYRAYTHIVDIVID